MGNRIPERFRRLPGEKAAGAVGDRAGDHHRHAGRARRKLFANGVDRRLGVERVENGFDQQRVDAAGKEPADLFTIGQTQRIESDGAKARIGDVGGNRGGPIGRTNRASDETRAAVFLLGNDRGFAREPGALGIELVGDLGHAVIGLRDPGR
jgi:hypothetical protein